MHGRDKLCGSTGGIWSLVHAALAKKLAETSRRYTGTKSSPALMGLAG